MSFKKNIFSVLSLVIVISLSCWLFFSPEDTSYVEDYNNKIEVLKLKIDSLHSINGGLIVKIDTLNQEISKLDSQIGLKDSKINTLKNTINEKVTAVDTFSNSELEKFFTDRYIKNISGGTDSTFSN